MANDGTDQRLFMHYASHVPHTPMQVPQVKLDGLLNISSLSLTGQGYAAMVSVLDDVAGSIAGALKSAGMWDNTLFVFQSDNGGPIYDHNWRATGDCPSDGRPGMTGPVGRAPYSKTCLDFGGAANNYPFRGGKASNWEGGIRVPAFISGGAVPAARRGQRLAGVTHTADWYSTFTCLAGVDPTDHRAAASGLPAIDSLDCWKLLAGENLTSPRTEFLVNIDPCAATEVVYLV